VAVPMAQRVTPSQVNVGVVLVRQVHSVSSRVTDSTTVSIAPDAVSVVSMVPTATQRQAAVTVYLGGTDHSADMVFDLHHSISFLSTFAFRQSFSDAPL